MRALTETYFVIYQTYNLNMTENITSMLLEYL